MGSWKGEMPASISLKPTLGPGMLLKRLVEGGNWHSSELTYSQVGSLFLVKVCRQLRIPCPTERVFWPNMCLGTLLFLLLALLSLDCDCLASLRELCNYGDSTYKLNAIMCVSLVAQLCLTLCNPIDYMTL